MCPFDRLVGPCFHVPFARPGRPGEEVMEAARFPLGSGRPSFLLDTLIRKGRFYCPTVPSESKEGCV
jgi:hypothetical protein